MDSMSAHPHMNDMSAGMTDGGSPNVQISSNYEGRQQYHMSSMDHGSMQVGHFEATVIVLPLFF